MQLEVGKAYADRKGTVWDCIAVSIDDNSAWCNNRKDRLDGLFTAAGNYLLDDVPHDYDLIREADKYVFKDDDTIIADNNKNIMVVRHGDNTYSVLENGISPHAPMTSAESTMRVLVGLLK